MRSDVLAVLWKEWRDGAALWRGTRGIVVAVTTIGIPGVMLPLAFRDNYATSPMSVLFAMWSPFSLAMMVAADAVAGERERHTLETLLASRLSDRALLAGKLLWLAGTAWTIALGGLLLGLVTMNLLAGSRAPVWYSPPVAVAGPLLSLLAVLGVTGLGLLVSMRAETVRQATSTLTGVMLAPMLLFLVLPILGPALPKESVRSALQAATEFGSWNWIGVVGGLLGVADVILLRLVSRRFTRSRLVL